MEATLTEQLTAPAESIEDVFKRFTGLFYQKPLTEIKDGTELKTLALSDGYAIPLCGQCCGNIPVAQDGTTLGQVLSYGLGFIEPDKQAIYSGHGLTADDLLRHSGLTGTTGTLEIESDGVRLSFAWKDE